MAGVNPRVPSVGDDPREQPDAVREPQEKVWFRDLDEAVIEADRCIQCGTCVAACPSDSIGIDTEKNRPTLVRMCTGCSSCWDYCPRSGLRYERVAESVEQRSDGPNDDVTAVEWNAGDETRPETAASTVAVRTTDHELRSAAQDGGAVTELLATLVEDGPLDGAVVATSDPDVAVEGLYTVADPDGPLEGTAALATTREALRASSGSVYNQVMSMGRVDDLVAAANLEDPSLALVGTPCVVEGARALGRYDHDGATSIALTVALMCTRSFEASRLASVLARTDVDPEAVDRLDVSDGVLTAVDANGVIRYEGPVDEFDRAGLRGCDECADFVGGAGDLSAGSVASNDGWTTLVVRTATGRQALERAGDSLDVTALDDTTALSNLADWNERSARAHLPREFDPEGPVGISRTEHLGAYEGTDRAPDRLNPARVHQYEEWC